jgi:uncharacterized phage protein (TIGR02216 family)
MRFTPDAFWTMSLPEWRAAVNGFAGRTRRTTPLARSEFEQLLRRFPDRTNQSPSPPLGERGKG